MKKISYLLGLFLSVSAFAQTNETITTDTIVSPILAKKNEVKIDVLNGIANGKLGISYERFINKDFSVGITGMMFNKNSKTDDFLTDDTRTLIDYQVIPYVRYAMSKSATNLYYLEGFVNFNGGEFKELTTLNNGVADYVVVTDDNPRSENPRKIRLDVLKGAAGAEEIEGRDFAIESTIEKLKKNDILLIAGKGHETYQIIGNRTVFFAFFI